jgi:hypothetical protein
MADLGTPRAREQKLKVRIDIAQKNARQRRTVPLNDRVVSGTAQQQTKSNDSAD